MKLMDGLCATIMMQCFREELNDGVKGEQIMQPLENHGVNLPSGLSKRNSWLTRYMGMAIIGGSIIIGCLIIGISIIYGASLIADQVHDGLVGISAILNKRLPL